MISFYRKRERLVLTYCNKNKYMVFLSQSTEGHSGNRILKIT